MAGIRGSGRASADCGEREAEGSSDGAAWAGCLLLPGVEAAAASASGCCSAPVTRRAQAVQAQAGGFRPVRYGIVHTHTEAAPSAPSPPSGLTRGLVSRNTSPGRLSPLHCSLCLSGRLCGACCRRGRGGSHKAWQ